MPPSVTIPVTNWVIESNAFSPRPRFLCAWSPVGPVTASLSSPSCEAPEPDGTAHEKVPSPSERRNWVVLPLPETFNCVAPIVSSVTEIVAE